MMNDLQLEDKAKLIDTLARARKDGNIELIEWCEKQLKRYYYGRVEDGKTVDLDYTKFETLGEIKDKYPDSTLVMRKQFVDMAIEHEWNHGRQVGVQLGICTELNPMCNAGVVARTVTNQLDPTLVAELEKLIADLSNELGKLHVCVTFYKEPR